MKKIFIIGGILIIAIAIVAWKDLRVSFFSSKAEQAPLSLYVSPSGSDGSFTTLEQARDALRTMKANGELRSPATVYLRGGTHARTTPFVLTPADSGTGENPITYKAYPGETPVISGGKRITSAWAPVSAGSKIYVTTLPEVVAGSWYFNSLFVNGTRAVRARTPDVGSYFLVADTYSSNLEKAFRFNGTDIKSTWQNLPEAEVVINLDWTQSRQRISSVSSNVVTLQGPFWKSTGYPKFTPTTVPVRYSVENIYEGLTVSGEWYLNKHTGKLYYYPRPGETMGSVEVVAPVTQQLLSIRGGPNAELDMSDTDFTLAAWVKPDSSGIAGRYIFSKGGSAGPGYAMLLDSGDKLQVALSDGSSKITGVSNVGVSKGSWHHVAAVWKNADRKLELYVDGISAGIFTGPLGRIANPNADLIIGGQEVQSFSGALDDVLVVRRALASNEFFNVPDATLLFPFDGHSWDISGSNKHGLVVRTETYTEGKYGQAAVFKPLDRTVVLNSDRDFVRNINFDGITFAYTDWSLPSSGYKGGQGGFPILEPWSMVAMDHVRNVNFTNSTLRATGTYAVGVGHSQHISILRNQFSDLGAGAVRVGAYQKPDASGFPPSAFQVDNAITRFISISDNTVRDFGNTYADADAIWLWSMADNSILHNRISDGPYIGINIGWAIHDTRPTYAGNNTIAYNEVHDVMRELNDGGGIHMLGNQHGTVIDHNVFRNIVETPLHADNHVIMGMYLDDGTSNISVTNNLVYNTGISLDLHLAQYNTIENNKFINGLAYQIFSLANNPDAYSGKFPQGNIFRHNIVDSRDAASTLFYVKPPENPPLATSDYNLFHNANNVVRKEDTAFVTITGAGISHTSTATATATPPPGSTLTISNSIRNESHQPFEPMDDETSASPGETVRFRTEITNNTSSAVTNVRLNDVLPPQLIYKVGTTMIDQVIVPDGIAAGGISLGTINPEQTKIIAFNATVNSTATPQKVTNTAIVVAELTADNPNWNLDWWKTTYGYERNSRVGDPLFVDASNNNYTLKKDSPAFALGFKDFDVSAVGPRSAVVYPNRPPELEPLAVQTIAAGGYLDVQPMAWDPDGTALSFSASGLPVGASIDPSSGQIRWTPESTQAGTHVVTIIARDGMLTDVVPLFITVTTGEMTPTPTFTPTTTPTPSTTVSGSPTPTPSTTATPTTTPVNQPPVWQSKPGNPTVTVGKTYSLILVAIDPEGKAVTYSTNWLPAGASLKGNVFTWTPGPGVAGIGRTIRFRASDGLLTAEKVITFTVVAQ